VREEMPPHPLCILSKKKACSTPKNSKEKKNHFKIFREIKAKERKSNRKFFSKEFRDNFFKNKIGSNKKEKFTSVCWDRAVEIREALMIWFCVTHVVRVSLSSSK
jgi:hypothetical protein